jgi:hypothetical protein
VVGKATKIAVDKDGEPWIVMSNSKIYRWHGNKFHKVNGKATEIAASPDGTVFILKKQRNQLKLYKFHWQNSDWHQVQLPPQPISTKIGVTPNDQIIKFSPGKHLHYVVTNFHSSGHA